MYRLLDGVIQESDLLKTHLDVVMKQIDKNKIAIEKAKLEALTQRIEVKQLKKKVTFFDEVEE